MSRIESANPTPTSQAASTAAKTPSADASAAFQQAMTGAPADQNAQPETEGVGAFLDGVVRGDFSDNDSWSATAGKVLGGLNPLADARDIAAGAKGVYDGKDGAWGDLLLSAIGTVPLIGDAVKAGVKGGTKVADEVAEAAGERAAKEATSEASEATAKHVAERMDELRRQGHGPQRHGPQVTEQQLDDRAMHGIDPVTGTTDDAYRKNADGTPAKHLSGKNATKTMSDESYVQAEEYVRNSPEFANALIVATKEGKKRIVIEDVRLESIFGSDYEDKVFGKTRIGSAKNPQGTQPTDFQDGTMKTVYIKNDQGQWDLLTMYPEPKK